MKMMRSFWPVVGLILALMGNSRAALTTNSWSADNGKWETGANWDHGVPTVLDSINVIKKVVPALSRTVTIDSITAMSDATNNCLTISNLTLSAIASSSNTLLLVKVSTPLTVLHTLTIGDNTSVLISNAAMQIKGTNTTSVSDDGSLTMSTGTIITTNAGTTFIIGDVGAGGMRLAGGTWQAADVFVGKAPGALGTLTMAGSTNVVFGSLDMGRFFNGTGTVWLTGERLTATNSSTLVGHLGTGRMIVSNGTWLARDVLVGDLPGSQGTLTMAGGSNVLSSGLQIGVSTNAIGAVWLTGGQLTMNHGETDIGINGVGQMAVSNGTWLVGDIAVGANAGSQGTLTVAGGTNVLTGSLAAGFASGATGAVWLTGGKLTMDGDTTIGESGVGQMCVSNGTWQVSQVNVGLSSGSQGTLTIAGGTSLLSAPLEIGELPGATGAVWITGGQLTVTNDTTYVGDEGAGQMTVSNGTWLAGDVFLSYGFGPQGILTVAGGTNILTERFNIYGKSNGPGTVWMTGGQLIVTNANTEIGSSGAGQMTVSNGTWLASSVYVGFDVSAVGTLTVAGGTTMLLANLGVGSSPNSVGTVWLTGGQLTVTNDVIIIGYQSVGRMTVSNGTWLATSVSLAANVPGGQATLTVAGGTSLISSDLTVGYRNCSSTGIVSVTGGELRVTNFNANAVLEVQSGTLTFSGGVLDVDRLVITNACGRFIHTGGMLITGLVTLGPGLDADGDGLPNDYEQANGLDPFSPFGNDGPDGDLDGDGMSNLDEMLAGTKPNDPNSTFRITAIILQSDGMRIRWTSAGGHTNAIQAADGGADGSYTNDFTDLAWFIIGGTGDKTNTFVDPDVATMNLARYYRIRVVP